LTTADALAGRFRGREQQISSLIEQTDQTFSAINVDGGKPLGETLDRAPAALDALRPALDSLNPPLADTRQTMVDLEPGARDLGASEANLRGVLREGVPVLEDVPPVADQATPAVEDLTPAVADLSTLTPRAADALNMLDTPLEALAPYSKELGYLFVRGRSFMSEGTANGVHYARLNADVQGPYSVGGVVKACNFPVNAYPKPGEADHDHTMLGLKSSMPCGVQVHPQLGGSPR
jgi:phospholipid/cholesterol/gamma-HCH transport system substrate-binding protein